VAMDTEKITEELKNRFHDKITLQEDKFILKFLVEKDELLNVMGVLKETYGFNHLANVTSVDYGEEFELVYHLYSIPENHKICIKTRTPRNSARSL